MSRTKKPCPGCKQTTYHRKSPEDVCSQCEERLKTAIRIEEFKAANKGAGNVVVQTVERHYSLPNIYHHCQDLESTDCELIQKAFQGMIDINIEQTLQKDYSKKPEMYVPPLNDKNDRIDWAVMAVMPKRQAEAINTLWLAVCKVLGNVADTAHERGRNLLLGVATGDVSVHDLNEATSRKRKRS